MFNDKAFLHEFRDFVLNKVFGLKVLEVGSYSNELLEVLGTGEGISLEVAPGNVRCKWKEDVREFAKREENWGKYDLVFSSGVLEHLEEDVAIEILEAMKKLVKVGGKVLNYVPNRNCVSYMRTKEKTSADWKDEKAFDVEEFEGLHQKVGLVVVGSGTAAREWVRRFGGDPKKDEPYLVYCLAERPGESDSGVKRKIVDVKVKK